MAERFMAAVLKTADVLKRPWVRIPLSPYRKVMIYGRLRDTRPPTVAKRWPSELSDSVVGIVR